MLTSGEYTALSNKLLDVNGFNEIFEDEVKEAKKLIKGGDADSNYAYYCLHELHLLPREYLNLSRKEQAFIAACIEINQEEIKKINKKNSKKK